MPAPANDKMWLDRGLQQVCVAQNVENGVGNVARGLQVETATLQDFIIGEHDVAEHREDLLADSANHRTVDECG